MCIRDSGYVRAKADDHIITWSKISTYVRKKGPKRMQLDEKEKELKDTLDKSITQEVIEEWGRGEMLRLVRKDYWSHPDTKGMEEKR